MSSSLREALTSIKSGMRLVLLIFLIAPSSLFMVSNADDGYDATPVKTVPPSRPPIPIIEKFSGSANSVSQGNYVKLTWDLTKADNAEKILYELIRRDKNLYEVRPIEVDWSKNYKEHPQEFDTIYVLNVFRNDSIFREGSIGIWDVTVNSGDGSPSADLDNPRFQVLSINSVGDKADGNGRVKGSNKGFKIVNIAEADRVAQVTPINGYYPADSTSDIWLFVVSPNGDYYPQSVDPCNDSWRTPKVDGRWEMWIGLGTADELGEFFDIVLTVASDGASKNISSNLKDWCESNYYPGWKTLPEGVDVVERITVIRNADRWGPAPEITNADLAGNVSISNIGNEEKVKWRENIFGNSSPDVEGDIWILIYAPNGRWYPQSDNPLHGENVKQVDKKWQVSAVFGGRDANYGDSFSVVAVLANDTASKNLRDKLKEWAEAGHYPGLLTIELPEGIDEKDRVRVYRKDDRWDPAPYISNANIPGDAYLTNIVDHGMVPQVMDILGGCSQDLGGHIWVMVYNPESCRWYPQSTNGCGGVHVQKAGERWRVRGIFGDSGDIGKTFDVIVFLADDDAHEKLSKKQAEWCNMRHSPGLLEIELPQGIDEKDRARVIRR